MSTTAAGAPPVHRDYQGAKIGMWLFLFTEIILFGGLFLAYSWLRSRTPGDFHDGGRELNVRIGVANTVILLTSSLSMALSISAIQRGQRRFSIGCLVATILLGASFLVNKGFEWTAEMGHGNYPGSDALAAKPDGLKVFFNLYYFMTGLHGLHVIAGISVLAVMLVLLARGRIHERDFVKLENGGLYWHLVDVIWIFLLPLFYLAA